MRKDRKDFHVTCRNLSSPSSPCSETELNIRTRSLKTRRLMIRDANLTAMSTEWRVFNSEWMAALVAKIGVEEKEKKGCSGVEVIE